MTTIELGVLIDVDPSVAWPHEARNFTPWLGANAAQIGDLIGLRLEFEGRELRVGRFSADLVMRDSRNGDRVLVENQYGVSDHNHLGKMITYLTGLEATKIIWVAPKFNDEHISAINWLNEHTDEPFAFFAVRVRVVRIGDSLPAPIFEVMAKPNEWDRHLQEIAKTDTEIGPEAQLRRGFWKHFVRRHPDCANEGGRGGTSRWLAVPEVGLVVSRWFSKGGAGVFVRGPLGMTTAEVQEMLEPHRAELERRLGLAMGNPRYAFETRHALNGADEKQWDAAADLIYREANHYADTLRDVLGARA